MKTYLLRVLLLLPLLISGVHAAYQCVAPSPIERSDFDTFQKGKTSADYFTSRLFGNHKVANSGLRLCRGVYEVDEQTGKPTNYIRMQRGELTKLDFASGTFECVYHDVQNARYVCNDKSSLKFIPHNIKRLSETRFKSKADVSEENDNSYMSSQKLYTSIGRLWDGEQAIDMSDFANIDMVGRIFKNRDLHKTASTTFTEGVADSIGLWNGKNSFFASGVDFRLSDFIIGTILLDDEVIAGTDAYGEVLLTDKTKDSLYLTRYADDMSDGIFNASGVISASSIFNKGAIGLYVEMFDAVMLFFGIIMWSLMGYSTMYFIGTYGGSHIVQMFGKADKAPQQPFDYRSKGASMLLVFSLMFVPQESGVHVNSGASLGSDTESGVQRAGTDTTFGKNIMNFFASEGTQFANRFSDLVMVRYLNHLANNFNVSSTQAYLGTLHDLKEQATLTKMKVAFYNDHCADAYLNETTTSSFMEGGLNYGWAQAIDPEWMHRTDRGGSFLFDQKNLFGPDYISLLRERSAWVDVSPRLCTNLENEIQRSKVGLSGLTLTAKRIMEHEATGGGFNEILENVTSPLDMIEKAFSLAVNGENGVKKDRDAVIGAFVLSQMANQKMYGYWNIVTLPILDIYMRMTTAYGALDEATQERVANVSHYTSASATSFINTDRGEQSATLNKEQMREIIEQKESEDIDEESFKGVIGSVITMSLYFFMPGFEGVWQIWKAIIDGAGTAIMLAVSAVFAAPTGGLSIIGLGLFKAVAAPAIKAITALWLATETYIILIKFLSMVLVMLFIFIKLWQMILEVIKYFFSSPAVFLMEFRQQNGQAIGSYVGRGFILLLIKPLLLVLTVIVFLSSYAIMLTAYDLLVDLGATLLTSANDIVDYSNEASTLGSFSAGIMTHAVRPFFDVIFHLFSVWVGYSIIVNGDKAFLDAVGYEDRSASGNDGKELIEQVKQKIGAGT